MTWWAVVSWHPVMTGTPVYLGDVDYLLETGANDVLVVRASESSIDDRERLIPFIESEVIAESI
jgi:16S rRNA processing protein RimM